MPWINVEPSGHNCVALLPTGWGIAVGSAWECPCGKTWAMVSYDEALVPFGKSWTDTAIYEPGFEFPPVEVEPPVELEPAPEPTEPTEPAETAPEPANDFEVEDNNGS